jgi:hypothetical protein
MPVLHASGNTRHWRKYFKAKGFSWKSKQEEWVHQNLSRSYVFKIMGDLRGKGIRFSAYYSDGSKMELGRPPSPKRNVRSIIDSQKEREQANKVQQKKEMQKIEEQAQASAARERASRIGAEPPQRRVREFGTREDSKKDSAANWSNSRRNKL